MRFWCKLSNFNYQKTWFILYYKFHSRNYIENEIFASADSNDYHELLLKVSFEENNSSFDELMFFFF